MKERTVPEENKALVRRFVAAADRSDFEEATRCLSPGIAVHIGGMPGSLDLATFFQFGQAWHSAFPDEETTFEDQIAEGDKVVSRMTARATHAGEFQGISPTGKRITVTGIWIDRVAEGKIVERWGQVDMLRVMQQLGALPMPARATAGPAETRQQTLHGDTGRAGSAEENKALIRRFWEEASRRGLQAVLDEFLAPDVVSHPPGSASPSPVRGLEAWKRFTAAQFGAFPDLAVTVEDLISEGDMVGARVTARGMHTGELMGLSPTGRQVAFTGMEVFRIIEGRITEQWGEFDTLGLLQQLGTMPQQAEG
jgi:predicted ester cyclase